MKLTNRNTSPVAWAVILAARTIRLPFTLFRLALRYRQVW